MSGTAEFIENDSRDSLNSIDVFQSQKFDQSTIKTNVTNIDNLNSDLNRIEELNDSLDSLASEDSSIILMSDVLLCEETEMQVSNFIESNEYAYCFDSLKSIDNFQSQQFNKSSKMNEVSVVLIDNKLTKSKKKKKNDESFDSLDSSDSSIVQSVSKFDNVFEEIDKDLENTHSLKSENEFASHQSSSLDSSKIHNMFGENDIEKENTDSLKSIDIFSSQKFELCRKSTDKSALNNGKKGQLSIICNPESHELINCFESQLGNSLKSIDNFASQQYKIQKSLMNSSKKLSIDKSIISQERFSNNSLNTLNSNSYIGKRFERGSSKKLINANLQSSLSFSILMNKENNVEKLTRDKFDCMIKLNNFVKNTVNKRRLKGLVDKINVQPSAENLSNSLDKLNKSPHLEHNCLQNTSTPVVLNNVPLRNNIDTRFFRIQDFTKPVEKEKKTLDDIKVQELIKKLLKIKNDNLFEKEKIKDINDGNNKNSKKGKNNKSLDGKSDVYSVDDNILLKKLNAKSEMNVNKNVINSINDSKEPTTTKNSKLKEGRYKSKSILKGTIQQNSTMTKSKNQKTNFADSKNMVSDQYITKYKQNNQLRRKYQTSSQNTPSNSSLSQELAIDDTSSTLISSFNQHTDNKPNNRTKTRSVTKLMNKAYSKEYKINTLKSANLKHFNISSTNKDLSRNYNLLSKNCQITASSTIGNQNKKKNSYKVPDKSIFDLPKVPLDNSQKQISAIEDNSMLFWTKQPYSNNNKEIILKNGNLKKEEKPLLKKLWSANTSIHEKEMSPATQRRKCLNDSVENNEQLISVRRKFDNKILNLRKEFTTRESNLLLNIIINHDHYKNFKKPNSTVWLNIAKEWTNTLMLNPSMASIGMKSSADLKKHYYEKLLPNLKPRKYQLTAKTVDLLKANS